MPLSVILILLLATQPLATDLYLPALPQIALEFGGASHLAHRTLTLYILAFGLAQLAAGPLVDRYGRRRMLLWGLACYTLMPVLAILLGLIGWVAMPRVYPGAPLAAASHP